MDNKIHKYLAEKIHTLSTNVEIETIYRAIGPPPEQALGHYAFPCFILAKEAKTQPDSIAASLAEKIKTDSVISNVNSQGPYLNFFITSQALGEMVVAQIIGEIFFSQTNVHKKRKIMIEYSQPNTHKILHVGHMRNLCLGSALVNIQKYIGHNVVSVTYPGDVGTHVAKCLWYLKYKNKTPVPKENKGGWLGEIYTRATQEITDGDKDELTKILQEIHDQKGEFYQLWKETRQWSIALMNECYRWAETKFDLWFWESEVDAPSLTYAKKLFKQGKLIEDNGAIGIDLSEEKLGFCILIKRDGTGLYATKDIELAKIKFQNHKVEESIYIVDNRQSYHFKQVFKILEKLEFEHADKCRHLPYEMVELPDGPMQSRKGNIVPLTSLISNMEDKIRSDYLNKYKDNWSDKEIASTTHAIAAGAIKYGMLKIENNRKIVFDMNEWIKLDGDTGPYLQYVYARIQSLLNKLGFDHKGKVPWQLLTKEEESALMVQLSSFNDVVLRCATQYKTSPLCSYLYSLGKIFNVFYVQCPIAKAGSKELKEARLHLAYACGKVIEQGLKILGINTPKRM